MKFFRISDDITVYRDGEYIASDRAENLNVDKLIQLMVGREVSNMFPQGGLPDRRYHSEGREPFRRSCGKKNVSFELHRGEILGMAGLVGAGRTETAEAIFGMRHITGGKIYKDGEGCTSNPRARHRTQDRPADRGSTRQRHRRYAEHQGQYRACQPEKNYGFPLNHKKMREDTEEYVRKLNTKTPTIDTPIKNLSGGNQQKVLVGRWLLTDPDILIVDEPTRGIDVGAKAEIHSLITKLAGEGKAIIMISSELPEVMGMSDRIVVMHEGTMTAIVDRKDFSSELI